jgi:hypothetical protein
MERFLPLAKLMHESDEALQALAMVLDDTYHEAVHGSRAGAGEAEAPKGGEGSSRPARPRQRTRSPRTR